MNGIPKKNVRIIAYILKYFKFKKYTLENFKYILDIFRNSFFIGCIKNPYTKIKFTCIWILSTDF